MNAGASEPDSSDPESLDLESAAADLYAADPDEFIARRTELTRAARQAGNRSLATAIGKLRKPTRSAWLVNLYAHSASDELQELLDLGAALRTAQEQLSAADLRRLSAQRAAVLAAATRRAVGLAEARGYRASEAVRQEVAQTLQAALAEPAIAEQVRSGAITEAHAYGGFGVLSFPTSAPAAADDTADRTAAPDEPVAEGSGPDEPVADGSEPDESAQGARTQREAARAAQLAAEQAERARAEAEQRLQAAETALDQALDRADEAAERAGDLEEQITTLRSQLRDLEEAKSEADRQVTEAQDTVTELQTAVREAREAYESL